MNAKQIHWIKIAILFLIILFILFLINKCSPQPPTQLIVKVNCGTDKDIYRDSLANKVEQARFFQGAQKFIVTGECEEQRPVIITQNDITITGEGEAIIKAVNDNAPVFNLVGARGVTLTGLTVQDGKQGILVTDGAQAVIYNVLVKNSKDTSLCIIGADKKDNKRPIKNRTNQTFGDCPLPDDIETLKSQKLAENKNLVPIVSNFSLASVSKQTFSSTSSCLGNTTNSRSTSTYVNICNSDFIDSGSGPIIYGNSTLAACNPNGSQCTLNINNNTTPGIVLHSSSHLFMQNATINLSNNLVGLVMNNSSTGLNDNSKINSTSNTIWDIHTTGSTYICNSGSSIPTTERKVKVVSGQNPHPVCDP